MVDLKGKARPGVLILFWLAVAVGVAGVGGLEAAGGTVMTTAEVEQVSENPSVHLGWVKYYNGPANLGDYPVGMAVDAVGNVYVMGTSYATGTTVSDFVTVKYSTKGNRRWVSRYHGPGSLCRSAGVALGADGSLFALGDCEGGYNTVKYDKNGHQEWKRLYKGVAKNKTFPAKIATDGAGNVYVTGTAWQDTTGSYDLITLKYAPSGKRLWESSYHVAGKADENPVAMTVDSSGNVFLVGTIYPAGSWTGTMVTVKLAADGRVVWAKRYQGPAKAGDSAVGIALDASGNVCVTGNSQGLGTSGDFVTIKYGPGGARLWVKRYNGAANLPDTPRAIAVDPQGNVYVTGNVAKALNDADYATVKYSKDGKQRWVRFYDGPAHGADWPTAMAVDGRGNVYVTGASQGIGTKEDYATVKYNSKGKQVWVESYSGPGSNDEHPSAISLDQAGNVYVTGPSVGSTGVADYVTIKYMQ
jgi:hypothetical protein